MPTLNYNGKEIHISEESARSIAEAYEEEWPRLGCIYYWITATGDIMKDQWGNWHNQKGQLAIGNVYKDEESAKRHVEYLKALHRINDYIEREGLAGSIEGISSMDIVWLRNINQFAPHDTQECTAAPFGRLKSFDAARQLIHDKEQDLRIVFGLE